MTTYTRADTVQPPQKKKEEFVPRDSVEALRVAKPLAAEFVAGFVVGRDVPTEDRILLEKMVTGNIVQSVMDGIARERSSRCGPRVR